MEDQMLRKVSAKSNRRVKATGRTRLGITLGKLHGIAEGWFAVAVLGLVLVLWIGSHWA